ncbi:MAG: hypothetical protein WAT91_13105, partial [Saprospiraceae bacterium]
MRNTNSFQTLFVLLIYFFGMDHEDLFCQEGSLLFHHLKFEDGLSDLTNQYVYKDSHGFIWISSLNGLNRFDGTVVKRYLPNTDDTLSIYGDIVQSNFFEDTASHLWFTTYDAINGYDRKHDCFHHYVLPDSLISRSRDYHAFYLDFRHELWFATDSTLHTFNVYTHKFSFVAKLKSYCQRATPVSDSSGRIRRIYAYAQPASGILEIICDEHEIVTDQKLLWIEKNEVLSKPRKIIVDGDSVIWIIAENILVKYNFLTNSVRSLPVKDLLAIEEFNDSLLLVSIGEMGVFEFNKNTFSYGIQYIFENDNERSLLTKTINYISKDNDNGYW